MVSLSLGKCRRILMPTDYDKVCTVTCTDNDKVAEAEVDRFQEKEFLKT